MRDREMVTHLTNDDSVDADRIMQTIASGARHEGAQP
jgi:simple sugar transport system ATP-binding protein